MHKVLFVGRLRNVKRQTLLCAVLRSQPPVFENATADVLPSMAHYGSLDSVSAKRVLGTTEHRQEKSQPSCLKLTPKPPEVSVLLETMKQSNAIRLVAATGGDGDNTCAAPTCHGATHRRVTNDSCDDVRRE